jgi:hypothetical protein
MSGGEIVPIIYLVVALAVAAWFIVASRSGKPAAQPREFVTMTDPEDENRHTLHLAGSPGETFTFLRPTGYELADWITPPLVLKFRGPHGDVFTAQMGDTLVREGAYPGALVYVERRA